MRLPKFLIATAVVLVLPASAWADPTATQITTPASPTFVNLYLPNPGTLHVEGTTSGGTGNVDLRCYLGATSKLVAGSVPVTNGGFSTDVVLSTALFSQLGYPTPYCTLRAVPAGTTPTAAPDQPSSWAGPELGWSETDEHPISAGGPLFDYYTGQAQRAAFDDYDSVGSCGLCDTYLNAPGTYAHSNPIWWGNAALYYRITGTAPFTRAALQVDGVDAYNSGNARALTLGASTPFPGVTYTRGVDPATGDMTVHEVSPFSTCSPNAALYPATAASCSLFKPIVELDRTIIQNHQGAQVAIVDKWRSLDGLQHQIDVYYDDTVNDANYASAGHESVFDYGWTPDGFTTYPAATTIGGPSGTATLYLKTDRTTPDSGDAINPIGAVTYGSEPTQILVRTPVSTTAQIGDWQAHYVKTVPATGAVPIVQIYSHGFALADVQALAQAAEAEVPALTADPVPPATPPAAGGAGSDPAPVASPTPALAPAPRCVVPKVKGRSLRTAKARLRRAHCALGKVSHKRSLRIRSGHVIRSTPAAGRRLRGGARIALVVAR